MKKTVIPFLAVLLMLTINVYSQPMEQKPLAKLIGKLNLTDEQKKDVEKIHFDAEKQSIALRAKLATMRLELRQILMAEAPDKSAIEKKMNDIADQGVQLRMVKVNSWFAVNKLLNADQQKEWKKVLVKGPDMMRKKMMRHHQMNEHSDDDSAGRSMPHNPR
jgi:Spy/CpxP family protein refolding chaperone